MLGILHREASGESAGRRDMCPGVNRLLFLCQLKAGYRGLTPISLSATFMAHVNGNQSRASDHIIATGHDPSANLIIQKKRTGVENRLPCRAQWQA